MLSAISPDLIVAVVTAVWFVIAGIATLRVPRPTGRRSVVEASWVRPVRIIRGVLQILLALAVLALAALSAAKFSAPPIGLWLGLALSALALWNSLETLRRPWRPVRIVLGVLGFLLAVFFAGFRG